MFKFQDIKKIQLEVSNYCNAACPQCPRNLFGGNTIPTLPLKKWSLNEFKKIFTVDLLNRLEEVYFCGTYGDPMTNSQILSMCKFLKDGNSNIKIGIHTNGGIGKKQTYIDLVQYVDFIAFGIDGLEDTNHIYRRHVNWDRLMKNVTAYIGAGGRAIWDFIVFAHNEHQTESARLLSKQLGFENFIIKNTGRFLTRNHTFKDTLIVLNRNNQIDYSITLPKNSNFVNENYENLKLVEKKYSSLSDYAKTTKIYCNSLRIQEIYIGADGFVFPCGWLHDRLYGPDIDSHVDHLAIKKLIQQAGGWKNINIFHSTLQEIVNGSWFQEIEQSWSNQNRLERCGMMCGSEINLIKSQNKGVTYKS